MVYELEDPFSDGTTDVLFEPNDFIARLAALVPRARTHLIRYHGVLPEAGFSSSQYQVVDGSLRYWIFPPDFAVP